MVESHARSVVKAISYRIVGTLTTFLITLLISRRITLALSVGLGDVIAKIVIFYVHERIWHKISFGKTPPPDYDI